MKFLSEKRLDEKLLTLIEMSEREEMYRVICASGPTDAGLIALAQQEQCALLTDDGGLLAWLGLYPNVQIELVKNVLEH